ncbi:hypothetical protein Sjap_015113 [Stephania japonica]|uniref:Uncharacterized protein n=1 Tax=Stephania japonica TaxID=461633 RepID=A0AAP0IIH8_9MAGN
MNLIKLLCFNFIFFTSVSATYALSSHHQNFILGEENLGQWTKGLFEFAEAPGPAYGGDDSLSVHHETLVLAAKRTDRPDVLCGFKRYRGGWDISNRHYWASVGFTGAAGFILAAVWFLSFSVAQVIYHCCRWRLSFNFKGSECGHRICLILLLCFTCAAVVGCVLLPVGQGAFHGEVLHTIHYVVNQSDYVVHTLRNVTEYLSLAKKINVSQVLLPTKIKDEIDKLNVDLNAAADLLTEKTSENSGKIRQVFSAVRSTLIAMAVVMLLLTFLGLFLSVLGQQHAVHIFILSGWLLVAITFILFGVFVILNNAIADTCMAMEEWADNPQAETALSNILPCVDERTTNKTLFQSKEVINQLVNVVNTAIYTFANWNPPPQAKFFYYNQSGPLMPSLCSPFDSKLEDQLCGYHQVSLSNASMVWKNYTCTVSESEKCTSTGRITPRMYDQLAAAVNASYALYHYAPPLLSLQNCNFVRNTFTNITSEYCPHLEHYLKMVNVGLCLISVGVMFCLILWLLYTNCSRRNEVFVKLSFPITRASSRKTRGSNVMRSNTVDDYDNGEIQL